MSIKAPDSSEHRDGSPLVGGFSSREHNALASGVAMSTKGPESKKNRDGGLGVVRRR